MDDYCDRNIVNRTRLLCFLFAIKVFQVQN